MIEQWIKLLSPPDEGRECYQSEFEFCNVDSKFLIKCRAPLSSPWVGVALS